MGIFGDDESATRFNPGIVSRGTVSAAPVSASGRELVLATSSTPSAEPLSIPLPCWIARFAQLTTAELRQTSRPSGAATPARRKPPFRAARTRSSGIIDARIRDNLPSAECRSSFSGRVKSVVPRRCRRALLEYREFQLQITESKLRTEVGTRSGDVLSITVTSTAPRCLAVSRARPALPAVE